MEASREWESSCNSIGGGRGVGEVLLFLRVDGGMHAGVHSHGEGQQQGPLDFCGLCLRRLSRKRTQGRIGASVARRAMKATLRF
ncbi:hypothetical protein GBA52_028332 [Prunus armeniaca]|nr:hypothetical protein GBA52_028332 [Prunus armeniaca]